MDLERWVGSGYDRALMADVVAWARLEGLIEAHLEDARNREANRKAKRR